MKSPKKEEKIYENLTNVKIVFCRSRDKCRRAVHRYGFIFILRSSIPVDVSYVSEYNFQMCPNGDEKLKEI